MAKLAIKPGSANVSLPIFIQDSSSTTGAGKTGLTYESAGLTCYYVRPGSAAAQLSLVTQTVTGAHADGGFVEIDSTNMPGFYRLDLSDDVIAVGVRSVAVMLKGATNMAPLPLEIDLANESDAVKIGGTAQTGMDIGDIPTATENADALLKRDWTEITGEAARSILNALRFLRNKWTLTDTTLSVKKEDDSTEAWSATVTTNANANPITGSDPG